MIFQWILELLHGLAETLFGWVAAIIPSPPGFFADATAAINTAFGFVPSSVRYFFPIGPMVAAAAAVMGLVVVLGTVRLGRRVLSLFTGGGGMA